MVKKTQVKHDLKKNTGLQGDYSNPSLNGHSTEATLSNKAINLRCYLILSIYFSLYFSLSPKATSLM